MTGDDWIAALRAGFEAGVRGLAGRGDAEAALNARGLAAGAPLVGRRRLGKGLAATWRYGMEIGLQFRVVAAEVR